MFIDIGISRAEMAILAVMALFLILITVRCLFIREGKVVKRYQVGKSMTIGSRQVQEDHYGISRNAHGLLAVLADGMGRNYGGKVAGRIAVDTIRALFDAHNAFDNPAYFFRKAFQAANREILKELDEGRGGASVAAAVIREDKLYYALAGNIKIAVFRNGSMVPLSAGHTLDALAREQYYQGKITREDAVGLQESKRLYHYLGQDGFQGMELFETPVSLRAKDITVMMSDGVFEGIAWKEIEECLARNKKNCQAKAYDIIEMINASSKEGKDNASIILIEQP